MKGGVRLQVAGIRIDLVAMILWVSPTGKQRLRPGTAEGVKTARYNKLNGFAGAWKLKHLKP